MISLNEEGRKLLIELEGIYLKPYLDSAKIPTIGIGTIRYPNGIYVTMSDNPITLEQAYEYLDHELEEKAATLERWININKLVLNGNQISSLLCFAYNCGCGPIIDRESSVNRAILSGKGIREAYGLYNKITVKRFGISFKKVVNGLTIRRSKEANLWFKG